MSQDIVDSMSQDIVDTSGMPPSNRPTPNIRLLVSSWPDDAPRGRVKAFCEEHGVSSSWFYKIRKLARDGGQIVAIEPASTRPGSSPNRTRDDLVVLVVKIRVQLEKDGLDCGPLSVLARLRRMGLSDLPSRATLARIFTQAGLVAPEPKKKPRSAYRRFVYPAPNCLWQIDATEGTRHVGNGKAPGGKPETSTKS
jgi:putative transposase